MSLRMKRIIEDKEKATSPSEIKPTKAGQELFGLSDLPLTLQHSGGVYLFRDNGIIRSGVSIELYRKYQEYFLVKDLDY